MRKQMQIKRSTSFLAGVALVTSMSLAGVGAASAAGNHPLKGRVIKLSSGHGITVKSVKALGTRQVLATIVPKALARPIVVRVVLPVGYQPDAKLRYPVLYLFPGTSGDNSDWVNAGDALKTTAPYQLITVSSDIGFNKDGGGWFTNWVDKTTALGPSQWETYDIDELIPWIDANFDTIRNRTGRGVAGLSQGGYGSTELAARHPDLFVMDGSFSGAPEIYRDPTVNAGAYAVISATMSGLNGVEPDSPFGNPLTDAINWAGHDPATTVENLRPVKLWLATADGTPGKYDDPVTNPPGYVGAAGIESATHLSTDYFVQHVREANIPAVVYDYGSGTHTWPYWARDLRHFIKPLMQTFAHPPSRPSRISYTTIEPKWSAWGWHVSIARPDKLAFSTLSKAGPFGFTFSGSGVATIVTPAFKQVGQPYRVVVGSHSSLMKPDPAGRLHIRVPLGAGNRQVKVQIQIPLVID
ncbi:MAG TPA: alpha/beta hydrolase family protein [Mycobacteriales bacterium]|nr:alpha/beta hydrolase family protein [Mycobacteriales bacterium]